MHLSVVSTVMGVLITELLFWNGLALKLRKMEISELLFCISKTVKKGFYFHLQLIHSLPSLQYTYGENLFIVSCPYTLYSVVFIHE